MGAKTKAAFTFTMNTIQKNMKVKDMYLWTFTFREVLQVEESIKRWNLFVRHPHSGLTASFPEISAIRVFEMHPGQDGRSHGLHVHMVCDSFLPVDIIRLKWHKYASNGSRINVQKISAQSAHYVGKYLRKDRDPCLKGVRLWQYIGKEIQNTRNSDIVIQSEFTDAYKFLCSAVSGFQRLSYGTRAVIVRRFVLGESIEECMRACQITQDYWQKVKEENEYLASLNDPFDGAFSDDDE